MVKVTVEGSVPEIVVGGIESMRMCSMAMQEGVERTFMQGGYPGPWQPLRSKPYGPARLYRSGRLFNSLKRDADETSATVSVPRSIRYAWALQMGYAKRNLVPRPYMLWREDMKDEVLDIVSESVRFEESLPEGWNP